MPKPYTKAWYAQEHRRLEERNKVIAGERDDWKAAAQRSSKELVEVHESVVAHDVAVRQIAGLGSRIRTRRLVNLGNFEHTFIEVEVASAGGDSLAADALNLVDTVDKWAALLKRRVELTRALNETEARIERVKRLTTGREVVQAWQIESSPNLDELGQQLEDQVRELRIVDAMWTGSEVELQTGHGGSEDPRTNAADKKEEE